MVNAKMLNEKFFAKLVNDLSSLGGQIKTRQDEKQAVLKNFESDKARFKKGHISEDAFASSIKKANSELTKLDKQIREMIDKAKKLSARVSENAASQRPKPIRVRTIGSYLLGSKKASSKKAPAKKAKAKKTKPKKSKVKKPASKKAKAKKSKKKAPKISRSEVKKEMKAEKKLVK